MQAPALGADELTRRLTAEFPRVWTSASGLSIEEVWHGGCRLRQSFREQSLRPGATISGATIMALGDYAVYVALLASIGWVPLAVTIAASLKRSALRSRRQKSSAYRAALSMLIFYINRAGRTLPASRKRVLEKAKDELRTQFGHGWRQQRDGIIKPFL